MNYKGAAASVLVRKGRGYHFVALLNYNGKILYGDPEAGNFEDITNNMGLLEDLSKPLYLIHLL